MPKNYHKVLTIMIQSIREGQDHRFVIQPLNSKFESWLFEVFNISYTLMNPESYYQGMIDMINDQYMLRKQQQKAKRYPSLVFLLTVIVLLVYVYVILPTYHVMFESFGITTSDTSLSTFILEKSQKFDVVLTLIVVIMTVITLGVLFIKKMKKRLVFSVIKSPSKYLFYYQLLIKMSIYSDLHMPYYEMFQMFYKFEKTKKLKLMYQHIIQQFQQGESVNTIFNSIPYIPEDMKVILPLTNIHNRSQTLKQLRDHYHVLYTESKQNLQSFIEPILLLFLGLMIGLIGYLMYAPLLEFYQSFGRVI
ncbi:MAG: hypothetical protein ACPF9F_02930 [Acholeplasmataceae bacterium]